MFSGTSTGPHPSANQPGGSKKGAEDSRPPALSGAPPWSLRRPELHSSSALTPAPLCCPAQRPEGPLPGPEAKTYTPEMGQQLTDKLFHLSLPHSPRQNSGGTITDMTLEANVRLSALIHAEWSSREKISTRKRKMEREVPQSQNLDFDLSSGNHEV